MRPLVLDTSVLTAIARADIGVIELILRHDDEQQPMVMPALAVAGACLDAHTEEGSRMLSGVEQLVSVTGAPVGGAGQASKLASVITMTGLDPWDAHVAAVAQVAVCPILTLNAGKWRQPSADLDGSLLTIEIADPEEPS